ncbi:MAG: SGNH/GDSL hydrolase family protein [Kiritimatiellae bacterium]|nr:SGNH/GDSL hydrolase family protein [Kiritimatiellia bacterium]
MAPGDEPADLELEARIQRLEQIRNVEIRHRGLSNLMADKLDRLRHRTYPASRLSRILCLGDSIMTAVSNAVVWDAERKNKMLNPDAESRLGFHCSPPHLEYRCVPAQLYEKLSAQGWQGDIEFRRFSHADFSRTGTWESRPLIEKLYPEFEKLGLPRFFDFMSPTRAGDAMCLTVQGKRYLNVVYAKRFESGSFRIELDGKTVREVHGPDGLCEDLRYKDSPVYSMNDVLDCREMIDLGDTKLHVLRLVALDVVKPVRIWGVEMWNTPAFVVMNGGKSGLNVNHFDRFMATTAPIIRPDIVIAEISGNDASKEVERNMAAYSRIIGLCMRAHVPILFTIPCLVSGRNMTMNHGRTLLKNLGFPYVDVQHQLEIEMARTGNGLDYYFAPDSHLNTPGVEVFSDQLLLPFLNEDAVQDPRFAGETAW